MNMNPSLRSLVETAVERHQTSVRQLSILAQKQGYRVTHTTLNQVRSGTYKSAPSEVTIKAIAWLAGVSEQVAFMAAGQPVPGPPFAEELPAGVDNLPPKARKAAIDMLRVLVDMNQGLADAELTSDQEQPIDIRRPGERRNARAGQKTPLSVPDDGNIPLPDNWKDLAAYTGPTSHKNREHEWSERGEGSQEGPEH
ncbi:hypothetical protein [Arthrobacter sp. D5-1]|uniref:hypothetical protein n=1 Tax=Arthrobacter sp. D5-1 TaxID=1477518 RepID=UPI001A990AD4|nr:hypothetical protein [Arthrobacter sp. D5-1]QSZ49374.1 hypothetical protein AYX22_13875 [Arthrobacter sp. D5-1]